MNIRQMLDAGAMGYIPKSEKSEVMLNALRIVLSGGIYVPPSLLKQPEALAVDALTTRQIEVLTQLCSGKNNKAIGRELAMSEGTVKSHIASIYRALNVTNRTQAARIAIAMGLLPEDIEFGG